MEDRRDDGGSRFKSASGAEVGRSSKERPASTQIAASCARCHIRREHSPFSRAGMMIMVAVIIDKMDWVGRALDDLGH